VCSSGIKYKSHLFSPFPSSSLPSLSVDHDGARCEPSHRRRKIYFHSPPAIATKPPPLFPSLPWWPPPVQVIDCLIARRKIRIFPPKLVFLIFRLAVSVWSLFPGDRILSFLHGEIVLLPPRHRPPPPFPIEYTSSPQTVQEFGKEKPFFPPYPRFSPPSFLPAKRIFPFPQQRLADVSPWASQNCLLQPLGLAEYCTPLYLSARFHREKPPSFLLLFSLSRNWKSTSLPLTL